MTRSAVPNCYPKTWSPLSNWVELLRDVVGALGIDEGSFPPKKCGAKKLFFKTEISRFGGRLPMINQNGHWKLSLLVSNPFISTTSRKYQLPPKRNGLIRPYPPRKRPSCLFRYSLDLLNLFLKTCTLSSWWKPEIGIKSSLGPGISLVSCSDDI